MTRLRRLLRLLPWAAALLVGALVPAALFAFLEGNWRLFRAAFVVCGLHALVLGTPALAIWREHGDNRLLPMLIGGLLIGALPIGSAIVMAGDLEVGSRMMALGLEVVAVGGGCGTVGALACWLTLYATRQFR